MSIYTNIDYNSLLNSYTIASGASQKDIQTVIDTSTSGAKILFSAGTYDFSSRLSICRSNISIEGSTDTNSPTIFKFAASLTDDAFAIKGKMDTTWNRTLESDVTVGTKSIQISDTTGLKVGAFLHIYQDNDADFLSSGIYDPVKDSPFMTEKPLRESMVEIESIVGNTVTFKHAISYDMAGGVGKIDLINPLKDVSLSNISMTYADLGTLNDNDFSNPLVQFDNHTTLVIQYTDGLILNNVTMKNTPSIAIDFRDSLDANVSYLTVDGAYNKGGDGNGYGLHISGTSYSNFEHLTITDVRHAVIFSSWSAEAWNTVQVDFTNRDINYHGSPDHSNTVIVNESIYEGSDTNAWALVSPGAVDKHPYTDISQNTNLFGHAVGGFKNDIVFGWDNGAILSGNGGDDILTGGIGNDLIAGGIDNDILTGRAGQDVFVYTSGDDQDIITDFELGSTGDILLIKGYNNIQSLTDVKIAQIGADTELTFINSHNIIDTIVLKNIDSNLLTAENFSFVTAATPTALNVTLSDGTDWFHTGNGTDDIIRTNITSLTADDVFSLGNGKDTLVIDSVNFTIDTSLLTNISGVDQIDATAGVSAKIIITQDFLNSTDNSAITILYGSNGVAKLSATGLDISSSVILNGNGIVNLSDNIDSTVTITNQTLGSVLSLRGNDTFMISSLSAVTLSGGAGQDHFVFQTDSLTSKTIINGGDGVDDMRLMATSSLSATDMLNVSGIEKIIFGAANSTVTLTDKLMLQPLEISAIGASILSEKLSIGSLTTSGTILVGENVYLYLSGVSSTVQTVKIKDGVNGSIKGSAGTDIIIGGNGNDIIKGQDGNDDITGGIGKDSLTGGAGQDTFRFTRGDAMDTINDFTTGASGDVMSLTSYYAFSTIADIQSAMTQSGTTVKLKLTPTEYISFKNQTIANFTAENFIINNSPILNLTLQATSSTERLITGGGVDVLEVTGSNLNTGDVVDLGAGSDILRLIGNVNTINTSLTPMTGIETIDTTLATSPVTLVLNDTFVASSTTGEVIIAIGSSGLTGLNTSAVLDPHAVILRGNNTNVTLADGVNNKIILDPMLNVTVSGGTGNDSFRLRGGDVTINGGLGNDSITVSGLTTLSANGGDGDDVFMFNTSSFLKGQTVNGGAGFDEIRLYQADTFDFDNLKDISGIERLTLAAGNNAVQLEQTFFDTALTLKANSGIVQIDLDMTHLDAAHKVIVDQGIALRIIGEAGDNYTIETTSRSTQTITGSDANETFIGGTAADKIYAGAGDDVLLGGYGKDVLYADDGNDILMGGRDADILGGGLGDDVFVFTDRNDGIDTILDFHSVFGDTDQIDLTTLFDSNGLGSVDFAASLTRGNLTFQQVGSDVNISFDRDGNTGSSAQIVIATVSNVTTDEFHAGNIIL